MPFVPLLFLLCGYLWTVRDCYRRSHGMRVWCMCESVCGNLPGQVKQSDVFWVLCPLHMAPPFNGEGLLQLRVRFWPNGGERPAHLHSVHWLHALQPPFTANKRRELKTTSEYTQETRQWIWKWKKIYWNMLWSFISFCCDFDARVQSN